ncbi:MAG TPA: WD40 repeat domain-containing serine/threonine-protein kinase [Leptolyngbyaceae cyanobacterium]
MLLKSRYNCIKQINQNHFGRTFLAVDEKKPSQPKCKIEQIFPPPRWSGDPQKTAALFQQEAVQLVKLNTHPQIPKLLAHFVQDNCLYLVQEFIEGINLVEELQTTGIFTEPKIWQLLTDLIPVLQFIHGKQIIHQNINPQNIIRVQQDKQLFLVGFSASNSARLISEIARTGKIINDFRYVAPEQAVGKIENSSDFYSLGITCIHLLTQKHPFDLYSFVEDNWVWQNFLQKPISNELSIILDKLIIKATKQRDRSISEVIKKIQDISSANIQPDPIAPKITQSLPSEQTVFQNWKCVRTLNHANWVFCTVISPCGKIFASGSRDKFIKICDLNTGKLLYELQGHTAWVRCLAFSPDAKILVSGSDDGTIKIWQIETGKLLHNFAAHSAPVWSVNITPDGQTIISSSKDNSIKLLHFTGQFKHIFKGHSDSVYSTAISPDGEILASGSYDKTIKIWNLNKKRLLHTLTGHSSWVNAVAISQDGQILASGSYDRNIKLWQLSTGKELATFSGHHSYVWSISFSPNGEILASASADHTIKLWQVKTGNKIANLSDHANWVNSVAFSPQGNTIVSGSNDMTVKIWRCD